MFLLIFQHFNMRFPYPQWITAVQGPSTVLAVGAGGYCFSSLSPNKTSVYWVYDLKSCRSYDKTKRSVGQY